MRVRRFIYLVTACCFWFYSNAQSFSNLGSPLFEKKWIKNSKSEMSYLVKVDGRMVEIGSFAIDIKAASNNLSVYTALQFLNSKERWTDTSISGGSSFKPVYRSSFSSDKEYVLNFSNKVTGYYIDKKANKKLLVNEQPKDFFIDSYSYPYLLGLLPLASGYRKDLQVYDYKPGNSSNIKKARIEEVRNNVYTSSLTGEHKVWQVSVFEEATNDYYQYYIDKETRRIWKIEVRSKGQEIALIDKEIDFNPFTTTFNKEETLQLIKSGNGVISGQIFARDNQASIKGIAILNVNKKQYARNGTSVILIPHTPFFKEWIKLNNASRKKGRSIPLPKEAAECIKVATVYDDDGHFEFVNLMPGEYLLYTEFGYVHKASRTEVIGYTDTYINGMFQGSSANTQTYSYNANASATVKEVVTIKKEEENVSVKLKKTN